MNIQPSYLIRKAHINDVQYFYDAVCSSNNINKELIDFDQRFKQMLRSKSYLFFVVEAAPQKLVGCAILEIRKSITSAYPFIEIETFFIDPKYRKWKAADFLYNALEEYLKQSKVFKLKVNCNLNSTLNQNFYTKKGFKISKKQYDKDV